MEADFNQSPTSEIFGQGSTTFEWETHQQVHTASKLDEIILINITILDASFDFKML